MANDLWSDEEWRAKMSTQEINDLPDSDFAYIEDGGEKDDEGKTIPRSLRHYPIQDKPHVRNALARASAAIAGDDAEAKDIADKAMPKIEAEAKKMGIEVEAPEAKSGRSMEWRQRKAAELRGSERRTRMERVEIRSEDDGSLHLSGYASVTESPYDMGWYDESIARGAFKKTLAEDPDVQLLINHAGLPLARTKSGTLQLSEDNTGLRVDADLDPEDPDVQSLARKMKRGDIDQMSFAFRATRQSWNEDYTDRTITECDLHRGDVSVVNQGANPATSSSIRTDDALVALRHMGPIGLMEAFLDLRRYSALPLEARAGATLSAATVEVLTQVLNLCATADEAVDEAQPLLAELLGVPNPDEDDDEGNDEEPAEGQRSAPVPMDFRAERARLEALRHRPRKEAA